jgi:hypothetical protein
VSADVAGASAATTSIQLPATSETMPANRFGVP